MIYNEYLDVTQTKRICNCCKREIDIPKYTLNDKVKYYFDGKPNVPFAAFIETMEICPHCHCVSFDLEKTTVTLDAINDEVYQLIANSDKFDIITRTMHLYQNLHYRFKTEYYDAYILNAWWSEGDDPLKNSSSGKELFLITLDSEEVKDVIRNQYHRVYNNNLVCEKFQTLTINIDYLYIDITRQIKRFDDAMDLIEEELKDLIVIENGCCSNKHYVKITTDTVTNLVTIRTQIALLK